MTGRASAVSIHLPLLLSPLSPPLPLPMVSLLLCWLVEELESEYFQDIKVASQVDSDRITKRTSTYSLEGSTSSRETQN